MMRFFLCLYFAVAFSEIQGQLVLQKYNNPEAICTDGSRGGFYYKRAEPGHEKVWVIYQQGGGWCFSKESCTRRYTKLKSSEHWAHTYNPAEGSILNTKGTRYDYGHKIYQPYCTSDGYIGNGDADGFHFRGRVIVAELFKELMAKGMGEGHTVIYSGCSAGGRGVMHNLNHVGRQLDAAELGAHKSSKLRLVGVVDSGLYLDLKGTTYWSASDLHLNIQAKHVLSYTNGHLDSECATRHKGETWKCLLGEYTFPTLNYPFVAQAMTSDTYQLHKKTDHGQQFIAEFIGKTLQSLKHSWERGAGIFAPGCPGHCSVYSSKFSDAYAIDGLTLATVVDNYAFETGGPIAAMDKCTTFACGLNCKGPALKQKMSCTEKEPLPSANCGSCNMWSGTPGNIHCYVKEDTEDTDSENGYLAFGSGACRGTSASHNPRSWYSRPTGFSGTLADCQALCSSSSSCKAIEFEPGSRDHCELWTQEPQATSGHGKWTCMKITNGNSLRTKEKKKSKNMGTYAPFGSGACRGTSASHNPRSWHTQQAGFSGSLADCQALCSSSSSCKAIEFEPGSRSHCELWTQEPQATSGNGKWTCMKKQDMISAYEINAESVISAYNMAEVGTELHAHLGAGSQTVSVPIDEKRALTVGLSATGDLDDINFATLKSFRKIVGYDDSSDYYNITVSMMVRRKPAKVASAPARDPYNPDGAAVLGQTLDKGFPYAD